MHPKIWRISTKKTLEALAGEIGCSDATLSRIENGQQAATRRLVDGYFRSSRGLVTANDLFGQPDATSEE
jgi:transcriptional regulator with XRE-family HTH domain